MNKEKNIIDFYLLATRLKDIIRTGWNKEHWHIKKERLESVAEHVYGVLILAIGIYSEYKPTLDFDRVLKMLIVHELEEVLIGDITPYQGISIEEKTNMGHEAIKKVLSPLVDRDAYYDLIYEFDQHETKESLFAYQCDKLEADIMSKYYQDNGYQRLLDDQDGNIAMQSKKVQDIIEDGARTAFDIWYNVDKILYKDEDFKNILEYVKNNDLKIN